MTVQDLETENSNVHELGQETSIWFKLSAFQAPGSSGNPMAAFMQITDRYGPVVQLPIGSQRLSILTKPEHFHRVLVLKADDYLKDFDGLRPVFGKSMITHDGVLWQKIRMPQQPAFHPDMFGEYVPFFLAAIRSKMAVWEGLARSGEAVEMVEQTWTLAADMICKALFDRDMPFNPHVVFKCVKAYTSVANHKSVRQRRREDSSFDPSSDILVTSMEEWASVPPAVLAADPREARERTLLKLIEAAVADPSIPEFDYQQAMDELKQYLWAGTETTALTLAWALYLVSRHPEAARRIREEGAAVYAGRDPTGDDYSALAYTRAVIQETMRLYPPVWGLIRTAAKPDEIDGKKIAAGDRVVLFTYGAHHSPAYWEEPEAFRPERWMGDAAKRRAKYTYLPFGAGKRSCIGGAMSQVENTLALSLLLRRFQPEYVGPEPPPLNATVTLTPKGGLHFKIRDLT